MNVIEFCIENISNKLKELQDEVNSQKIDLFLAKTEASTLLKKILNIKTSLLKKKHTTSSIEIVERDAQILLSHIIHEISVQEKEEYFNSNNDEF